MKKILSIKFIFFYFLLLNNNIYSQVFERIENSVGFYGVSNNHGVAVADYDGDNDLDIFIVAKSSDEIGVWKSYSRLFRNNEGVFEDVTENAGLLGLFESNEVFSGLEGQKFGVSWGDYDNDGFPDLFFTFISEVKLFHNNKDGSFTDTTSTSGITINPDCRNTGATWFDYNNDGFLDIYINDWGGCKGNSLFKNKGDGTFVNIPIDGEPLQEGEVIQSYTMTPYDFNNDGYLDIYVSTDFQRPNTLLINNGNDNFSEEAINYGVDSRINDMGIAFGDINNDGDFDIFITGINENVLLENNGHNLYSKNQSSITLNTSGWGWGCKFADFDLDGDEDLFVVNGVYDLVDKNTYFKNLLKEGGNDFQDDSENSKLGEITNSTEALPFDFDNDGDLDIFVTNTNKSSFFYENKLIDIESINNYNWLKVDLEGTISNRNGFGAVITVKTSEGNYVRNYTGVGFLSQSIQSIHFGLNNSTIVTELKIEWPSGIVETYQNLDSNVTIKAKEAEGIEINREAKIYGCTDPNSCNYNPEANVNNGTCEYIAPKTIIGSPESGFNKIETYFVDTNSDSEFIWTIEGGELLSGQSSNTITVKWGFKDEGRITFIEHNNICSSLLQELTVNLSANLVPEKISVARIWNEALLDAIRTDYARPTVHARNLFHSAIALFDSWAIYDEHARPYLTGNTLNNFKSVLNDFTPNESVKVSQEKAMSYAVYRLLNHRFKNSPNKIETLHRFDRIMEQLGYDINYTSTDYESGNAADLGNYIGETIINYGKIDNANEANDYANRFYEPINPPMKLSVSNNTGITDPNRWQPLEFNTFIDQSGNEIVGSTPDFLSPEWGEVFPFALNKDDHKAFQRDGNSYTTYHDPKFPPQLNTEVNSSSNDLYKWNFSLVSLWSSHLDPSDGVLWDISPNTIGNIDISLLPNSFENYSNFYDYFNGGDISIGHSTNPYTGKPYESQYVPRADYARVLAEFWADGPDSETPPGHWFTILNYVSDHSLFEKKFNGQGTVLPPLEWDVKSYFILGGAMHDSAITAWGIKGWVDYIRPISAIRYLCELGQSSDSSLPNYHIAGIPLIDGYIELIEAGDPLEGDNKENIGQIKLYSWRGHDFIQDSNTDVAGVGWVLAKNWWPYQRPSFVTPPFAGYVSGHSTFSRAAAEVMTLITGDEFFPGGMGEFIAKKNEFLVFEKGPSVDVKLQWATYRDASDQTSLSRIWGGIHPPVDDIPGRLMGMKIGIDAYNFSLPYFSGQKEPENNPIQFYPNPVTNELLYISNTSQSDEVSLFSMLGQKIEIKKTDYDASKGITSIKLPSNIPAGLFVISVNNISKIIIVK